MLGCFPQMALYLCWGVVEGNSTDQFLCSQRGLSVNVASLGWALRLTISPLCVLGALQIAVSSLHVPGLFACLFSKSSAMSSGLSHSQACWPLKLQVLSPTGFQKSWYSALLTFQANCFWGAFSLCTPLCVSLSLTLLHDCNSLPTAAAIIHFSPICISALPTFSSVASSLSLMVDFVMAVLRSIARVFGWFDIYLFVFVGQGKPKVFLLCHHLPTSPKQKKSLK